MTRILGALCLAALVTGCAFNPQQANIAPSVVVAASSEGAGQTVAFRVMDERDSKSLGNRGNVYGKAAQITAQQDVSAVVSNQIRDGLTAKGFRVVGFDEQAPTKLTVELRSLDYETSIGFWTGGVQVKSAIKAVALRDGKAYEKMYRADDEKRVVVVPTAGKNEEWLNAALKDVLTQFFEDVGLMRHMSGS